MDKIHDPYGGCDVDDLRWPTRLGVFIGTFLFGFIRSALGIL